MLFAEAMLTSMDLGKSSLRPDVQTKLERDGFALHVEHYRASGEGCLSLVIVHGFGSHCGLYPHLGRGMAARSIAVTIFDGRGHGKSGGQRGHVDDFADYLGDLAAVVDWARARSPGIPWALMGHSLGGAIAAAFVLDGVRAEKPSRLVLAAPWLKLRMKVPASKAVAARLAARLAPRFSSPNGLRAENISRNPEVVARFNLDPLVHHLASAGWFMTTLRAQARLRSQAGSLKTPTLILLAGQDKIVANEASLAFARAAGSAVSVRTYDPLFHELFLEPEASQVIDDIATWLVSND
jgi:alpha-beta hydrolase superfamily lysophospholipase